MLYPKMDLIVIYGKHEFINKYYCEDIIYNCNEHFNRLQIVLYNRFITNNQTRILVIIMKNIYILYLNVACRPSQRIYNCIIYHDIYQ